MIFSGKKILWVSSFTLILLISLVSIGASVYAEENSTEIVETENSTVTEEITDVSNVTETTDATNETNESVSENDSVNDAQMLVGQSILSSMLQKNGMNESESQRIAGKVAEVMAGNQSEINESDPDIAETKGAVAEAVVSPLLKNLGVNESVNALVIDYVKTHNISQSSS